MPIAAAQVVRRKLPTCRYDNTVTGYYIENFGCRAAQADGAAIERQLADLGMRRVDEARQAQVVVLNTCTVTSAADHDARAAVRRVHREQPEAKILVTGCYAQRAPKELAGLDGVAWVVGNSHKNHIGNIVGQRRQNDFVRLDSLRESFGGGYFSSKIYLSDIFAHTELQPAPVFDAIDRTRPNLKVQDGCDNRCSFCVIPFVRGQSRSLKVDDVLREVDALEAAGYREIVISGINLGRWGRDFASQMRFIDLLNCILERTSIAKLRLSSVEPMDWTDELIALIASSARICKHAHVPLQSGSDRILRRMHRKYRPWHYAEKLEQIRSAMPDAAIGADLMVGFPGETDALFEESRRFIEQLPLTYLHVFTYSPRPGTPAAGFTEQVPLHIARERNRELRKMSDGKNLKFRSQLVGRTLNGITLTQSSATSIQALSDNYIKVEISGCHTANRLVKISVNSVIEHGLSGVIEQV
jgi:threonylcarbamoyladenosine tRNA methylthiotransferase MtaB